MYSIADYDNRYRPYDKSGGELKNPEWVKMPAKPKGEGLCALLEHNRGLEVFGVWCLLLQKATKEKKPENRGKLLNHKELPATVEEIAKGISLKNKIHLVKYSVSVLVEMGWVNSDYEADETSDVLPPTSAKSRVLKSTKENNICTELFNKFWILYPRKDAKQRAVEWFSKNKPSEEDVGKMGFTIERQKKKGQRLCCKRQYMPLPTTWLNDGDWRDAPTQADIDQLNAEKTARERKAIEKEKEELRQCAPALRLKGINTNELKKILTSKDIQVKRQYFSLHWLIKEILDERKGGK